MTNAKSERTAKTLHTSDLEAVDPEGAKLVAEQDVRPAQPPEGKLETSEKAEKLEKPKPGSEEDEVRQAREDLGETIEELAAKFDLRRQARRKANRAEVMAQKVWAVARKPARPSGRATATGVVALVTGGTLVTATARRLRRRNSRPARRRGK
jgi:acetyl-CoA acetyltransferase